MQHFSREQLIASLLQELTKAQAGFQAAQLAAWRELAPGAALPAAEHLAAIQEIKLQLQLAPYVVPWPQRLYRWLRGSRANGPTQYRFATPEDSQPITLTLRAGRGSDGYRIASETPAAPGESQ